MSEQRNYEEHVLVCLSSAPSNENLIRKAAMLSAAFHAYFTALYIRTPDSARMSEANRQRLEKNQQLARDLGARLEIVQGENIAYQIAEYARVSGVTKIVIGRSLNVSRAGRKNRKLIDTLLAFVPDVDVYIIPAKNQPVRQDLQTLQAHVPMVPKGRVRDPIFTVVMLLLCSGIGWLFQRMNGAESNIVVFYIFCVFLISVQTANWIYSLGAAIASVVIFNFLFTPPVFTLQAYDDRYTLSFGVMFVIALFTGLLAARLKLQAQESSRMAFRIQVLYDMNQLLEKTSDADEILDITGTQLVRLLHRNIVVYPAESMNLQAPLLYPVDHSLETSFDSENGRRAAAAAFEGRHKTGNGTEVLAEARCVYYPLSLHDVAYGVVGVDQSSSQLDPYADGIVSSILSEAALALENKRNEDEKEAARMLAQNEQLRANLLRSISHDLRTPLTSIAGAANILLTDGDRLEKETRQTLYTNVYDDAMWLEGLVENLLAITRLEEGQMKLHMTTELVSEVVQEACRHCDRKISEHTLSVEEPSDFLMAKMDAQLIMQILINLINNAVKYTQKGSHIKVASKKAGEWIEISVSDDGPGIAEDDKAHIFEMFYSGKKKIADSRRSLGIGLALCRSVVQAHGGRIWLEEAKGGGCIFRFTLPAEEADVDEQSNDFSG